MLRNLIQMVDIRRQAAGYSRSKRKKVPLFDCLLKGCDCTECSLPGSNWRPLDYETNALPTEPRKLRWNRSKKLSELTLIGGQGHRSLYLSHAKRALYHFEQTPWAPPCRTHVMGRIVCNSFRKARISMVFRGLLTFISSVTISIRCTKLARRKYAHHGSSRITGG